MLINGCATPREAEVIDLSSYDQRLEYDEAFDFVWVFMASSSKKGALGAPSGIFLNQTSAEKWIQEQDLTGILYRLPIGLPLCEYADGFWGDEVFVKREREKNSVHYTDGSVFLGYMDHEHF